MMYTWAGIIVVIGYILAEIILKWVEEGGLDA